MKKYLALILFMFSPALALAAGTSTTTSTSPPMPTVVIDPNGGADVIMQILTMLSKAYQEHQWTLVAGLLLTLVVVVLRLFAVVKKLPDAWIPWATMGLATAASVAIGLQTKQSWINIVSTGVAVGVTAIGGWETFGKLLRGLIAKLRPAPGTPPAPPQPPPGG